MAEAANRPTGERPLDTRPRWLGVPVNQFSGSLDEVRRRLPHFERRPFIAAMEDDASAENRFFDMIVREKSNGSPAVPVGVVSKSYQLVQHESVFDLVLAALRDADIDPSKMKAYVELTEHGERMALSLVFPDEPEFRFLLKGEDELRLRFECFNSVDGSTRFMAVLGWLRFVCLNGLVLGKALANIQGIHGPYLDYVLILANALKRGLTAAEGETATYRRWIEKNVARSALERWVDGPLREKWGVKAATRAFHIAVGGFDVELTEPFEKAPPTQRRVKPGANVPGALVPAEDAFAVSQALSWLAGRRREVPEQHEWTSQIPALVEDLIAKA